MWIRVESFEPSSSPGIPTAVWNFFGGRHRKEDKAKNRDTTDTILFSLGRKTGDVTFPNDKSVSRQHCAIRCIYEDEARTNAERQACQANPFHMCLVVDNFGGKAGTFIAESSHRTDDEVKKANKHDVNNPGNEETDDEGGGMLSQAPHRSQQQLAALGDGTHAIDMTLPPSIWHFWKEKQPPLMVRLDVGQSRVLHFSNTNEERFIMVQPGYQGSTLKITWVPFFVVFSRVRAEVHNGWKKKLPQVGALEESTITEATTHLVTPSFLPTAKPLTAYCRGIPIVTPDFLQALMDYKSSKDPLPPVQQYLAPFPEDGSLTALQSNNADPKLMTGYVVFTLDETEIDPLVRFAGGTLVPLHRELNEKAKMDKVEETRKACAAAAAANNNEGNQVVFLVMSSRKRIFSKLAAKDDIFPLKPETWAKAVARQDATLVDSNGNMIPLPTPLMTRAFNPSTNSQPKGSNLSENDSDTEDEAPVASRQRLNTNLQTQELLTGTTTISGMDYRGAKRDDSNISSRVDSSPTTETPLPNMKRQRREPRCVVEKVSEQEKIHEHESNLQDDDVSGQRDSERTDQDKDSGCQDASMEDEDKGPSKKSVKKTSDSNLAGLRSTTAFAKSRTAQHFSLAKPDAAGWFTIAPKDNALRKAWRKQASKMSVEENDGQHLLPPAQSEQLFVVLDPKASGKNNSDNGLVLGCRPRRTNGPNFKAFRKNIVPRNKDADEQIPLQAFEARESEQQKRLEVSQRELEEQQRRADELFRDIGAGSSTTRRRRR